MFDIDIDVALFLLHDATQSTTMQQ